MCACRRTGWLWLRIVQRAQASPGLANEPPRCPVLLHFGETDASIPREHWDKVREAQPTVPMHIYPAGHGFNCEARASYHEPSARLARERTIEFLRRNI